MKGKRFMKVVCLALALTMGASTLLACGGSDDADNYAANNTAYFIGTSGPLTGGAAVYGIAVKNSAQMAVDEINAAGGLDGVSFKFEMKDDVHKAENVKNNYASLYEAGMQVSLGTVTSTPCLAWKALAKEDNVFCLTPSATSDEVPVNADNMYQMCFTDSSQGTFAAKYIQDNLAGKTVGVFYNNSDAYSTGIYNNFVTAFGASNIAATATFTDDTATDFSSQVATLANCDLVFMPIYYGPASLFITQVNSTGTGAIAGANTIFFGCDGFDGIDSIPGFDVNKVSQEISYLSHFNANDTTNAKTQAYVAKYTQKYGTDTLNQFGAAAYDCVYAIYNALKAAKAAGKNVSVTMSASDMCDVLKATFQGGFSFSGVTGTNITWATDGTVVKAAGKYSVNK